ncbi:MAG: flavodoxin [Candidatus Fimousia sp.]
MKRIAALMMSLLLMCTLAACSSRGKQSESSVPISDTEIPTSTEKTEPSDKESTEPYETESSQENLETATNSNILIVYFSRYGNTDYPDDVDATTSASIVAEGNERYGTTEYVAYLIQQTVGGDVHRIETVTHYTADFDELRDVNHEEMQQGFLPELKESNLDISTYDTVFIGYPVWATSVPQAVLSFLEQYDLSGKTVIPFCTHDGYGAGSSFKVIADASHATVSPEGIAIEAKDVPTAQNTVADWLTDIGISSTQD